jgi:hypothetical protein
MASPTSSPALVMAEAKKVAIEPKESPPTCAVGRAEATWSAMPSTAAACALTSSVLTLNPSPILALQTVVAQQYPRRRARVRTFAGTASAEEIVDVRLG